MVELLTFDRPEVCVAAAWGLRRLPFQKHFPRLSNTLNWSTA